MSTNQTHPALESTRMGSLEEQRGSAAAVKAIKDVIAALRTATQVNAR